MLVRQTWGSNYIDFLYDESGLAYSFIYNGTQYYYVKNLQGDVVAIANSTGTIVVNYTYDAWGNILSITGSSASTVGAINPIRYRSYYYDTETGFYYLQSRYYDPAIRRFINADGAISDVGENILGYNQYAYCFNNPVNMSDSEGNWPSWETIGKVALATVTVVAVAAVCATGIGAVAATLGVATASSIATTAFTCGVLAGATTICDKVYSGEIEETSVSELLTQTASDTFFGSIRGGTAQLGGSIGFLVSTTVSYYQGVVDSLIENGYNEPDMLNGGNRNAVGNITSLGLSTLFGSFVPGISNMSPEFSELIDSCGSLMEGKTIQIW